MKRITCVLVAGLLVGCASTPPSRIYAPRAAVTPTPPVDEPRAPVTLTPRAFDEIAAARARELALHALSQVGTLYRYGGASPEAGFDCSGLVQYVFSRGASLALPRDTRALSTVGAPVSADALEPGDLVFFDTLDRPYSHVGIYLGDSRFIHAPKSGGHVELMDLRHRYWQTRFNGARRIEL